MPFRVRSVGVRRRTIGPAPPLLMTLVQQSLQRSQGTTGILQNMMGTFQALGQEVIRGGTNSLFDDTSSYFHPDWSRMECRYVPIKLESLVTFVDIDKIEKADDEPFPDCSVCLEPIWDERYSTDFEAQPEGTDHIPACPTQCPEHIFHFGCLKSWVKEQPSCPLCREQLIVSTGFQPRVLGANMSVTETPHSLAGYDTCGTIVIDFTIPSGVQDIDHPLPGEHFEGMQMQTYLPNNSEGQEILRLLKLAWNRRLLFRIGYNPSTKRWDKVIPNGFEFKTSRVGGMLMRGFPYPIYMSSLKSDLMSIGVR